MKLDKFDILVMAAALLLMGGAAAFALNGASEDAMPRTVAARIKAAPPDPAAYQELARAQALMDSEQTEEAISALINLAEAHPAMSEPHALLGQAHARLLDYPPAMREFRIALAIDPDYADKKSSKFIGKRIKAALKEGMTEAKDALSADPDDRAARASLKDAYYIERMLAGGCE